MPNAPTHDAITLAAAAVAAPILLYSGLPEMDAVNTTVTLGAFVLSGLLFSPDLDLRSASYMRWGKLRFIWLPYQRLVRHRSWISHSLLAGPLIRFAYFGAMALFLALVGLLLVGLLVPLDASGSLRAFVSDTLVWADNHRLFVFYALCGFVAASALHSLTDTWSTSMKRRTRRSRRW
jgi:uncharacterized metal-binding protein